MSEIFNKQYKVLRIKPVKAKTGLCRATIYNKLDPRSKYYDPHFPKRIRLGAAAVGWIEAEIDAWIASRVAA